METWKITLNLFYIESVSLCCLLSASTLHVNGLWKSVLKDLAAWQRSNLIKTTKGETCVTLCVSIVYRSICRWILCMCSCSVLCTYFIVSAHNWKLYIDLNQLFEMGLPLISVSVRKRVLHVAIWGVLVFYFFEGAGTVAETAHRHL